MNTQIVEAIIGKFGGVPALQDALGLPYTTVKSWVDRGSIPSWHQPTIIAAAQARGIELTHSDFFQIPKPTPQPRRRKP